jgi:hypothetical protein
MKVTWRLHIEMIEAKTLRTFIRVHSIFESKRLSANIKLTHKALISIIMTCLPRLEICGRQSSPETAAPGNKVLRIIGKFSSHTLVRDLHMIFRLPYVYDYVTKLYRQQAEVIHNHDTANVRNFGQGEARRRKHIYRRLKLGDGQAYDR